MNENELAQTSAVCVAVMLLKKGKDSLLKHSPDEILSTLASCPRELTKDERLTVLKGIMALQEGVACEQLLSLNILKLIQAKL